MDRDSQHKSCHKNVSSEEKGFGFFNETPTGPIPSAKPVGVPT